MRSHLFASIALLALPLTACSSAPPESLSSTYSTSEGELVDTVPTENWNYDLLSTDIRLDIATLRATASIQIGPNFRGSASFEVGDLEVTSVRSRGGPLPYRAESGRMDVAVPKSYLPTTLEVIYTFKAHAQFDGWDPAAGVSFLWPYFCGNLFPCKSSPNEGVSFRIHLDGVPAGMKAVYPSQIPADAPSYMPAVAVGEFTEVNLGTTRFGTQVKAWHLPGQEAVTAQGTAHLRNVFDFFETTYGRYTFGPVVGSVSANWGPGDYGGMEHHPYWHVAKGSFYSEEVHAHEAAHGWYGNGVRVACWEDFVLSEGTATYLAARALARDGVDLWPKYDCSLKKRCDADQATAPNTIALPDTTCNQIDILNHPLWSGVPYQKGAQFYRKVEQLIGVARLDQALAAFYGRHHNKAARMEDMLEVLRRYAGTKADAIDALANSWLRSFECPAEWEQLCPTP